MPIQSRRDILKAGAFAAALMALPGAAFAAKTVKRFTNGKRGDRAIGGYDAVAYFQKGAPAKGAEENRVSWMGAEWLFESAAAAGAFKASPDNFAPQFGGYCTFAMSIGKIVPSDPEVWRMKDGKLYLFAAPPGRVKFDKGADAMIAKAEAFWSTLTLVE